MLWYEREDDSEKKIPMKEFELKEHGELEQMLSCMIYIKSRTLLQLLSKEGSDEQSV